MSNGNTDPREDALVTLMTVIEVKKRYKKVKAAMLRAAHQPLTLEGDLLWRKAARDFEEVRDQLIYLESKNDH